MTERICERLREIEADYGFRIVYACESGSRAWGFASEDSDYDVRFIYTWQAEQYLSIYDPKDQVDLGVDAENLDFSGWDLRKALPLFRKSNGALMEWLHSPIVYFEDPPVVNRWRELVPECFAPKATAIHYLGLCRKMWLSSVEQEKITAKKYLYIVRALLSARFIAENQSPVPVEFAKVMAAVDLSSELESAIEAMIKAKANQAESDKIERVAVLDNYIEAERELVEAKVDQLETKQGDVEPLNQFFRNSLK